MRNHPNRQKVYRLFNSSNKKHVKTFNMNSIEISTDDPFQKRRTLAKTLFYNFRVIPQGIKNNKLKRNERTRWIVNRIAQLAKQIDEHSYLVPDILSITSNVSRSFHITFSDIELLQNIHGLLVSVFGPECKVRVSNKRINLSTLEDFLSSVTWARAKSKFPTFNVFPNDQYSFRIDELKWDKPGKRAIFNKKNRLIKENTNLQVTA
jgi:hypothetical protein